MRFGRSVMLLGTAVLLGACAAGDAQMADGGGKRPSVERTGTVIEVKMMSVGGEKFGPSELTVQRGDVVKFVLESGVHNVSFPADKNFGGVKLPETSPYLQVPGQAHEILIDLPAGEYTFHCDPHAVLGMVGKLTVQD